MHQPLEIIEIFNTLFEFVRNISELQDLSIDEFIFGKLINNSSDKLPKEKNKKKPT
ncbi:hypothetical protein AB1K32_07560 [Metabacillus dongyingensis]|uniref:hypothetical protein n=1 Tax=Metabacillus dongyingensis TaxID=2874282 RepID=UPI003B8E0AC5